MINQKLIKIDLSWKKVTTEKLIRPDLFPGGRRDIATGENSYLFITTGPLTGTGFPGSNRVCVTIKSMINGSLITDVLRGSFGPRLRQAGIDHIVITGKAKDLSYIVISDDGHVNIRAKKDLSGLSGEIIEKRMKKLLGENSSVIAAGPAGEKNSFFALLYHEGDHTGSGGYGSVLYSKNIVAVVIEELFEAKEIPVKDQEKLDSLAKNIKKNSILTEIGRGFINSGEYWLLDRLITKRGLPAKNYYLNAHPESNSLSLEKVGRSLEKHGNNPCNCPISCKMSIVIDEKEKLLPNIQDIVALGPQCGIYDIQAITGAVDKCVELGIDPVMSGISLACLIELIKKKKLIVEEKVDWSDLGVYNYLDDFLNVNHAFSLSLSRGGAFIMKKYNESFPGTKDVSGIPVDINKSYGSLLQAVTSIKGMPGNLNGSFVPFEYFDHPFSLRDCSFADKARLLKFNEDLERVLDSMIWCNNLFLASCVTKINEKEIKGWMMKKLVLRGPVSKGLMKIFNVNTLADIWQAITGIEMDARKLMTVGERTWIMEVLFNIREGQNIDDLGLPDRFFSIKKSYSQFPSKTDLEKSISEYLSARKLNKERMPSRGLLDKLNISEIL